MPFFHEWPEIKQALGTFQFTWILTGPNATISRPERKANEAHVLVPPQRASKGATALNTWSSSVSQQSQEDVVITQHAHSWRENYTHVNGPSMCQPILATVQRNWASASRERHREGREVLYSTPGGAGEMPHILNGPAEDSVFLTYCLPPRAADTTINRPPHRPSLYPPPPSAASISRVGELPPTLRPHPQP
jgi:hypothetical protein